jgi:hypothetical protein
MLFFIICELGEQLTGDAKIESLLTATASYSQEHQMLLEIKQPLNDFPC